METQTCPKCGFAREPKALDCPVCGIVYAKFERGAAARPAPAPSADPGGSLFAGGSSPYAAPPPLPPMNPYAAPQANLTAGPPPVPQAAMAGVWRSGDTMVLCKGYPLPGRCVVCNRETTFRWQKTFSWVPGWVHLLILLQLLIYLIVYLSVRKQADVGVPLCQEHEENRKQKMTLSWVLCLGGVLLMFGCIAASDHPSLLVAILLLGFASIIVGAIFSVQGNVLKPVKIDNTYAWFKKVNPEYLAVLPEAMIGM